jgi:hypothetical protein
MPIVSIPADRINDWDSFHDVFAQALGFPEFYGRNMDAWNDCLLAADADDGMISPQIVAGPGDVLTLQIENAGDFAERCPAQFEALVECAAFVNWARIDAGERPILALSFSKNTT